VSQFHNNHKKGFKKLTSETKGPLKHNINPL